MTRVSLIALVLLSGCGGAPPMPDKLPDLSLLDQLDQPVAAEPASCKNGFMLTPLQHRRRGAALFARTRSGVWHAVYGVPGPNASGLTGLRHVSSSDPAHADSIAWTRGDTDWYALAIGPDDVPTLFYATWVPPGADSTISRARWIHGAWQIDPTPIGNGSKVSSAVIDGNGHAHVGLNQEILTDASGSWTTENLAAPLAPLGNLGIRQLAVDGKGHEYATLDAGTEGAITQTLVASNASGSWRAVIEDATEDSWIAFLDSDAKGDMHAVNVHYDLFRSGGGTLVDQDLTAGTPLRVAGSTAEQIVLPDQVRLDKNGNPVAVVLEEASDRTLSRDLVSIGPGGVQTQRLPLAMDDVVTKLVVDGNGAAHLAVLYGDASGVPEMRIIDSCP